MNKIDDHSHNNYHIKLILTKALRMVICIFLSLISIFPFYIMIINSTRDSKAIEAGLSLVPGSMFSTNFEQLMAKANGLGTPFWKAIINSFLIATPSTIFGIYFSSMTAYGIHVYEFKAKKIAWTFILAIMMIPTQVSIIGFFQMVFGFGWVDSYWPLILPSIAAPNIVFFMRQYMRSSLSIETIEAARIDGSSEFRTFNLIVLPLLKPAMATQAIFVFIASWNNLFTPSIIITSQSKLTLPMFVQQLRSEQFRADYGVIYMGLFLTVIPIFVVYFLLSKYIVAGVALGGVKE